MAEKKFFLNQFSEIWEVGISSKSSIAVFGKTGIFPFR